jgi:hypothetical protein
LPARRSSCTSISLTRRTTRGSIFRRRGGRRPPLYSPR